MSIPVTPSNDVKRLEEFWALGRRIAHLGTTGIARMEFLRELSRRMLDFSGADAIHLWMTDVDQDYRWLMSRGASSEFHFEPLRMSKEIDGGGVSAGGLERRIVEFMRRLCDVKTGTTMPCRSFHVHDQASRNRCKDIVQSEHALFGALRTYGDANMLLLPLHEGPALTGLLVLCSTSSRRFSDQDCFNFEQIGETIGRAVVNRRAQFRLRERIKELTCLHGIAQVVQREGVSSESTMQAIVEQLPPAMQFPVIAAARLILDDRVYSTNGYRISEQRLTVPVVVGGRTRGSLEVSYIEMHPEFAAGAFLPEERDLLNNVTHEIALLVERSESAAAKASLAEQLRHADRLATIGQLAAGVAHELNEPLGNIMGFAQLLQKSPGLSETAHRDAEKIVEAVLHGREIVKKLLLFSRQSDAQRVRLDLSTLIRESLYFLEARCRRSGIDLQLDLSDGLPPIAAVPSEMTQVLVNLAVNAMQAMPTGGALTIRTRSVDGSVLLTVEDTGVGMDETTQRRLFTPFFTTKNIGEGTGLGLSVVLGIVSTLGGTIHVQSTLKQGSRFEIRLPPAEEPVLSASRFS